MMPCQVTVFFLSPFFSVLAIKYTRSILPTVVKLKPLVNLLSLFGSKVRYSLDEPCICENTLPQSEDGNYSNNVIKFGLDFLVLFKCIAYNSEYSK